MAARGKMLICDSTVVFVHIFIATVCAQSPPNPGSLSLHNLRNSDANRGIDDRLQYDISRPTSNFTYGGNNRQLAPPGGRDPSDLHDQARMEQNLRYGEEPSRQHFDQPTEPAPTLPPRRPIDRPSDRLPGNRVPIGPALSSVRENNLDRFGYPPPPPIRQQNVYGAGIYGSRNYPTGSRSGWTGYGQNEYDRDPYRPYDARSRNTFRQGATRYRAGKVRESDVGCPTCIQCGPISDWRTDLQGQCRESHVHDLEQSVTVKTGYGTIEGFYVYLYDGPGVREFDRPGNNRIDTKMKSLAVFLGIPYAMPPVDDLRFKPPRPHKGWQLWQATDFGPACPQPARFVGRAQNIFEMDEDCLYLNVYTPSVSGAVINKYPVIIYIHGGQFERGASNLFSPHALVAWHDVVVVTFNYRLGALGFLSTGDEQSPGNYGTLDQALAIRWVYENAHVFNGDPRRITLWGVGAGAAAAGLHILSPRTQDKIFGVFAQSGSALADWAALTDVERAKNTSRVFADRIGCPNDNAFKLVDCLRKGRSYNELAYQEIEPDLGMFPWAPVVDKRIRKPDWHVDQPPDDWHFLSEDPEILVDRREYRIAQYMTGVTRDEAAYILFDNKTLAPSFEVDQRFFDEEIRKYVHKFNYTMNPGGVFDAIKYLYTFWPDPTNRTMIREEYVNFLSDALFKAPVDHMMKKMVQAGVPTYMYVLNTTVDALHYPQWRQVPHEVDTVFFTGAPFMDKEFFPEALRVDRKAWTEGDRNMSEFFLKAVANFAYFGRPTPEQIFNVNWEPARVGDLKYLNVNNTFNTSILTNYRQQYCGFWTHYLPLVVGNLIPTIEPTTEYWWEPNGPIQIAFWSALGAAVLFMIVIGVCCCLWCSSRRALTKAYRDYAESAMYPCVEENFNAFATPSSIPATPLPPPSSTLALIQDSKEDLVGSQHGFSSNGGHKYAKNVTNGTASISRNRGGSIRERPRSASGVALMNGTSGVPSGHDNKEENVYSHYPLSKSSDELSSAATTTGRAYHERPASSIITSKSSDRLMDYDGQQNRQAARRPQQPPPQQLQMVQRPPQGGIKVVPPVVAKKQLQQQQQLHRRQASASSTTEAMMMEDSNTTTDSSGSPMVVSKHMPPPAATSSTLGSRRYTETDTLPMTRRSYVIDDEESLMTSRPSTKHSVVGVPVLPTAGVSNRPVTTMTATIIGRSVQQYPAPQQQQPQQQQQHRPGDLSASSLMSTNSSSKPYLESTC